MAATVDKQPTQVRKEYPNGDVFDGLVDGVTGKRRYGTLSLKAEGIQYIGDFVDGEPSGKGTIVYSDRSKFEGEHHKFQLIKGEYRFPDEERHEGVWFCNCPTKEGLRKYKDGRRSQQGMMVVRKGKNSPRFKVNFVVNNGMRVVEDWRGTATGAIRESVTFIPVAALQYEEALVRACSTGNTGNVSKVLKTHGVLAKFALDSSENKCAPCLVVAAANGFVDVVKILLMNGADSDCCDTDMHNAFHAAAFFAHAQVLAVLCELKSTSLSVQHAMNARSESGETPLQMAVTAYRQNIPGADECVRLLINAGADPGDMEPSLIVLDPSSLLFNTLLFLVPPPTEVLLQSYLRSNPHSASRSTESDGVVSKKVD